MCGTNGTRRDSLLQWALDPERLIRSFRDFRRVGMCTPNRVAVEERPIFVGDDRWWSMCELLTGSLEWGRRPFPTDDLPPNPRVG